MPSHYWSQVWSHLGSQPHTRVPHVDMCGWSVCRNLRLSAMTQLSAPGASITGHSNRIPQQSKSWARPLITAERDGAPADHWEAMADPPVKRIAVRRSLSCPQLGWAAGLPGGRGAQRAARLRLAAIRRQSIAGRASCAIPTDALARRPQGYRVHGVSNRMRAAHHRLTPHGWQNTHEGLPASPHPVQSKRKKGAGRPQQDGGRLGDAAS
jgi:hypothetical protein